MSLATLWPLAWPSEIQVKTSSFELVSKESSTASMYSGAEKIYRFGDYLRWTVTLPMLTEAQAKTFRAFILSLQGRSGTFWFSPPEHDNATTGFLGSATVNLTERNKILTLSHSVSGNISLRAGDWLWFQELGQMVMVISDHPTPAETLNNVLISPAHRFTSASGTKLCHNTGVQGVFRMEARVPIETGLLRHANATFSFREAF